MWSPLVDAAEIAAQLSRTRGMLALDIGDVDGAEASLREALSHYEKLQFTAGVAAVALDLNGLLWHLGSHKEKPKLPARPPLDHLTDHCGKLIQRSTSARRIIAASRTPLWLVSGWGCPGRLFPEVEEILVGGARFCRVALQGECAGQTQVRNCADEFILHDPRVVENFLKLGCGCTALVPLWCAKISWRSV